MVLGIDGPPTKITFDKSCLCGLLEFRTRMFRSHVLIGQLNLNYTEWKHTIFRLNLQSIALPQTPHSTKPGLTDDRLAPEQ